MNVSPWFNPVAANKSIYLSQKKFSGPDPEGRQSFMLLLLAPRWTLRWGSSPSGEFGFFVLASTMANSSLCGFLQ